MRRRRRRQWVLPIGFGVLGLAGALIIAGITRTGHTIDMAVMHFLLFYGGVFALIGLTASVGIGLLAADRIVMTPSRRIVAQAVHRAVSFGAVAFLVIHILTEIMAGRATATDAVVPFLGQHRTLYLGMGTIASDLILLILVTGIVRGRFAAMRPAWMWRVLHCTAYLAWLLGILHGLLDGRRAKPYVDWSYGACVAAVGIALLVRLVVAARIQETATNPVPAAPPWLTAGSLPATLAPAEPRTGWPPRQAPPARPPSSARRVGGARLWPGWRSAQVHLRAGTRPAFRGCPGPGWARGRYARRPGWA